MDAKIGDIEQDTMRIVAESFGYLFLLSQRFEYMTSSILKKDNLTTKQLLTLIAIKEGFEEDQDPTIGEVAQIMSTSHQNIKKIALQLKKRGFLKIVKDNDDKRRKLLKSTEECDRFWNQRAGDHTQNLLQLFGSLEDDELLQFHNLLMNLINSTDDLYKEIRGK
jgi:DNA-binding MarR family transcriptional regulator